MKRRWWPLAKTTFSGDGIGFDGMTGWNEGSIDRPSNAFGSFLIDVDWVWWNSRWRQTQRNLSTRTATDGNVLIAVDILTMNVYEIILDGTLSSTTKCPKIALMASTFLLPFVLDDADDFWISMTHQNVALVILPKTSHGPNPWHRPQGQQLLAGTSFGM